MNEQEQREAIAEVCHWKQASFDERFFYVEVTNPYDKNLKKYPALDPLQDLGAMHEAEKMLEQMESIFKAAYVERLICSTHGTWSDWWPGIHATAKQRAEAFLRTIGKWKD